MKQYLSKDKPAHRLFAAFHDHELPNKRELCEKLRKLIQTKIIRGSHSIEVAMSKDKATIPHDIYHAMVEVTGGEPKPAPAPALDPLENTPDKNKRRLLIDICQLFREQLDRVMEICQDPNAELQMVQNEITGIDHYKMMLDFSSKL